MFGPWFFMGAFWGGIASTILWSLYLRTKDKDIGHAVGLQQRHDLGKLAFAFTVFWTYLFFSQYIVIWYGKLPWEQAWIIHRSEEPWGHYSAAVVSLCFVIPFAGLIGPRRPDLHHLAASHRAHVPGAVDRGDPVVPLHLPCDPALAADVGSGVVGG